MVEEQFDQKVSLALGSTLTEYNSKYSKEIIALKETGCGENEDCYYFDSEINAIPDHRKDELTEMLSGHLQCFGIEDQYDVAILDKKLSCNSSNSYCCTINPSLDIMKDHQLYVSFPLKGNYVYDKLKFMIFSSVLISLLLALVSFIILKALVQQKIITDNNIDFFNNTAHELKTPLTNITLALSLFNRQYQDTKGQKYLDIIKRENSRLAAQIEKVLYLSKMESEEYSLQEEAIDLKVIVSEAVNYMEMISNEKNGTIQTNFPAHECIIKGDPFHLKNICINLIDNSLKYCTKTPQLSISISEECGMYKLLFSDNGIGISKNDQAHIFKKFQRVNTGDIKDSKGFGIGLSYVKKALELHKGQIVVKSELNKGSQFEISLPIT